MGSGNNTTSAGTQPTAATNALSSAFLGNQALNTSASLPTSYSASSMPQGTSSLGSLGLLSSALTPMPSGYSTPIPQAATAAAAPTYTGDKNIPEGYNYVGGQLVQPGLNTKRHYFGNR